MLQGMGFKKSGMPEGLNNSMQYYRNHSGCSGKDRPVGAHPEL